MKRNPKPLKSLLLTLLLLLSLAACASSGTDAPPPDGASSSSAGEDGAPLSCSLTIRCDTLLEHLSELAEGKAELVPEDGLLLFVEEASLSEDESAFDVLKRELQSRRMHLEFSESPAAYIEGICNLYEYDCGELSGWIYRVNGEIPGYSCSEYLLSDGDVVEFLYTCDLGDDL